MFYKEVNKNLNFPCFLIEKYTLLRTATGCVKDKNVLAFSGR